MTPSPALPAPALAARYGLLGLPLAFVALPVYVHLPHHYAQVHGLALGALGLVLLLSRSIDAVVDPWLGQLGDRLYHRSWAAVRLAAVLLALGVAGGFAGLFFPPDWARENTLLLWAAAMLTLSHLAYSGLMLLHQAWAARQGGGGQARITGVTTRRFFRKTRIDEQQRYALVLAGSDEVRPQLGFHDDAKLRTKVAQKGLHCPGRVIRQIGAGHRVAEQRFRRGPAGRSHLREQDAIARIAQPQGSDQRLGGARFANRNSVNPERRQTRRGLDGTVAAKTLAPVLQVVLLSPCAA